MSLLKKTTSLRKAEQIASEVLSSGHSCPSLKACSSWSPLPKLEVEDHLAGNTQLSELLFLVLDLLCRCLETKSDVCVLF